MVAETRLTKRLLAGRVLEAMTEQNQEEPKVGPERCLWKWLKRSTFAIFRFFSGRN
jgi:hypothetical protein